MERVKHHKYLYRRGDTLLFRRSVPPRARAAFGGKTEVWVSLGTASVAEAHHLLLPKIAEFERTLSQVTGRVAPVDVVFPASSEPTKIEIGETVRAWFADRIPRVHVDYAATNTGPLEAELKAFTASIRDTIRAGGEPAAPLVGAVTTRPPAAFSSFTASAQRLTQSSTDSGSLSARSCRASNLA